MPDSLILDCVAPQISMETNGDLYLNHIKYEAAIKRCQNQVEAQREWNNEAAD